MSSYISIFTVLLLVLTIPSVSYMIHSKIRIYLSVKALKIYMYVSLFFGSISISFFFIHFFYEIKSLIFIVYNIILAISGLIFFLRKDIDTASFAIQFVFSIVSLFMTGWLGRKYSLYIKFEKSHMLQFRRSRSNISTD